MSVVTYKLLRLRSCPRKAFAPETLDGVADAWLSLTWQKVSIVALIQAAGNHTLHWFLGALLTFCRLTYCVSDILQAHLLPI